MYKYIIPLLLLAAIARAQTPAPGGVAGPKLWIASDFDAAGTPFWKDQISGQHIGPEQLTALKAEQVYLNFNPAYPFEYTPEGMEIPLSGLSPDQLTLFRVYQARDTFSEKCIWSYNRTGSTQELLTTHRLADLSRMEYMNFPKSGQSIPRINTYIQHQGKSKAETGEASLVFARPPRDFQLPITSFQGKLPELILYDRVLSPEERQRVESYLAIKYGTSLDATQQANYLSANGQVTYAPSHSGNFIHRIAGIGRDDLSGLQQKQSGSSYTPDLLVISAGEQSGSNATNATTLPDQHFLLWADNDRAFGWGEKQALQPLALQRQWQIHATGTWASIPTELRFDTHWLCEPTQPGETYWLIIDRSGEGLIAPETQLDYYPLSQLLPDGKASFRDVRWDTDGSSQDIFTIATGPELMVQAQLTPPQCRPEQAGSLRLAAIGGRPPYRFQLKNEQDLFLSWAKEDGSSKLLTDLPPGTYELLLTDADQWEFRESFFFQSADAPAIPLTASYQLKPGQSLLLNAEIAAIPGLQYEWRTPEGKTFNSQELSIDAPGTYQVLVDDQGCLAQKTIIVDAAPSGNFRSVNLYPNPSTDGHFQLRVHLEKAADLQLRVFDAVGRLIWQQQQQGSDYYHTGNQLSVKGAYILQLRSADSQISLPLIIQ